MNVNVDEKHRNTIANRGEASATCEIEIRREFDLAT